MGHEAKKELIRKFKKIYKKMTKDEKSEVIDNVVYLCGYNRKYATRKLNEIEKREKKKRGRKKKYNNELLPFLKELWFEMDQPCSIKMEAAIPNWLPYWDKKLTDEIRQKLLDIKHASIDRLLAPVKVLAVRKRNSGTKPGSLIKNRIPIQTTNWNINEPGYLEADTVAHCGNSLSGEFVWSITYTDIKSTWTENRATWTKAWKGVKDNTNDVIENAPFKVKGFDCDNGSEFLNQFLEAYFLNKKIKFTRSRPYKKNDNAHVEQKNWTHVRSLLGYDRFDERELVELLNNFYKNSWSPYQNFFLPTIKLLYKIRVGGKIKKKYDKPKTPYVRLLESSISEEKKQELRNTYSKLNPFILKKEIDKKLNKIFLIIKEKNKKSE